MLRAAPPGDRIELMMVCIATDTPTAMIRDLRTIIDGWEYEPGKISVRKIIGRDGREKIQTRIDLGLLQLETSGRPDGQRPRGCETLIEHFETKLLQHMDVHGDTEDFVLSPEDCRDLRHEAYLFYQRYLSQFVLEDYDAVARDTAMTLRLIDLCQRFGTSDVDRTALRNQRSYVLMMNTRARACRALQQRLFDVALNTIEQGLQEVRTAHDGAITEEGDAPCAAQQSSELEVLEQLRDNVLENMPESAPAKIRQRLADAIEAEDYERAAALRDELSRQESPPRRVG